MLTLVMREERLDKAGAIEWLEQQGFLRKQDSRLPLSGIFNTRALHTIAGQAGRTTPQHPDT